MSEGWAAFLPTNDAIARTERDEDRAAKAEEEARRARSVAAADNAEQQAWLARATGRGATTVGEVLERSAAVREPSGVAPADLRRARAILAEHGLERVLPPRFDAVLDQHLGVLDSPRRQPDQAIEEDAALARMREDLADDARWFRMYLHRHPEVIERARRRGRPVGDAVRSEQPVTCADCIKYGATPEQSFLLHADPDAPPAIAARPVTVPDDAGQRSEVARLVGAGFSLETAQQAARPVISR